MLAPRRSGEWACWRIRAPWHSKCGRDGMLRFLTAGESHGPALVGIVEGLPAGLAVSVEAIDRDLARRQVGYGAGARMKIEHDRVQVVGGLVNGETIGAPVALRIENLDY